QARPSLPRFYCAPTVDSKPRKQPISCHGLSPGVQFPALETAKMAGKAWNFIGIQRKQKGMVPEEGVEPTRSKAPADFESAASASSATPGMTAKLLNRNILLVRCLVGSMFHSSFTVT